MKLLILALTIGLSSAEWVTEMENQNPPGIAEMSKEQLRYVEGDMVMDGYEEEAMDGGVAYTSMSNTWPKQSDGFVTIPYENTINSRTAAARIQEAFADYKKYTCIRFRPKTSSDRAFISFYQGGGCSSPVGYYSWRKNTVSLARGCWYKGTIMHEIAHSLGIYHEQSRQDRDDHVTIVWSNIPSNMQFNFKKTGGVNHGTAYDYRSMMHYGRTAFGSGRITIRTKDPAMQNVIGQRGGMSEIDKVQINRMYKCGNTVPGTDQPPVTAGPPTAPPGGCVNHHSRCDEWQKRGECDKNPTWMHPNCPVACDKCGANCVNKHSRCDEWAKRGECSNNPGYMNPNCPKACAKCV